MILSLFNPVIFVSILLIERSSQKSTKKNTKQKDRQDKGKKEKKKSAEVCV